MARAARLVSGTGIYHIAVRGTGRQALFYDKEDYRAFQRLVLRVKQKYGFTLYAYCIMSNHAHFLLRDNSSAVSAIMQRISSLYAEYFNGRYDRKGHLFQGRFYSDPVECEAYFWAALAYIHGNPCRAGIAEKMEQYGYSSYREYVKGAPGMTDTGPVLKRMCIDDFLELHSHEIQLREPDGHPGQEMAEEEACRLLCEKMDDRNPSSFAGLPHIRQRACIRALKERGVTYAQIARLTGMPYERIRYLGRMK